MLITIVTTNFNSIKVQLKQCVTLQKEKKKKNFNSIKVQLKRISPATNSARS